jgi:serine/threonine-protein kinase
MQDVNALASSVSNRYDILREVGRGGMATVYLARDRKHERDVAIKVLRADLAESVGAERFLAEIKTTAGLSHPHILPLHDSGEASGFLYYVMPFVSGETLRERLDREGQLPIEAALTITREIADGLTYAHARGVIHRDIKPENIFLAAGHALLADFGIARALSGTSTRLTSAGLSLGTPIYMSPEQMAGDPSTDARTDQYALASVLFEMLAGEPPFNGTTTEAILVQRFTQPPPRIVPRRSDVSRTLETVLMTALDRDPQKRFETVARFAGALESYKPRAIDHRSIAVLPFANISGDADNEYFSDGVAEEIMNALAQLPGLRVAARTSAFSYKNRNVDLRTIGEELGVATVLQGTVRKAGNRIRVTAQLVDVGEGYNLWSERYDRELVDVFAIQDGIASAIATRLNVTLVGDHAEQLVKPPTEDVDAYDAYLKARALMQQRGVALVKAIESFELAIARDPEFAAAHAYMAEALLLMSVWGQAAPSAVTGRATAAVENALRCDPDLPQAHVALGMLRFWAYDRDGASEAWSRALELGPTDSEARVFYALYHLGYIRGQFDDALEMLGATVAADPRSAHLRAHLSVLSSWAGRSEAAVGEATRAIELAPEALYPNWSMVLALIDVPSPDSVESALAIVSRGGRHSWLIMGAALCCAAHGRTDLANALHDELEARAKTSYVQTAPRALCALAAGRTSRFYDLLRTAVDARDPLLALGMGHWPALRPERGKPQFDELLARMGWPTSSGAVQ